MASSRLFKYTFHLINKYVWHFFYYTKYYGILVNAEQNIWSSLKCSFNEWTGCLFGVVVYERKAKIYNLLKLINNLYID